MMRLLLDTHALIWWWKDDAALSPELRETIAHPNAEIFVSAVSAWEMATKIRKGGLPEMRRHMPNFHDDILSEGFRHLGLDARHAVRAGLLGGAHKDPADRLIAAQALLEDLTLVTRDREMASFGCKVLW